MNNQTPMWLGFPMPPFQPPQQMPQPRCNCTQEIRSLENRISRVERQIRRLEERVNRLEQGFPTPYRDSYTTTEYTDGYNMM